MSFNLEQIAIETKFAQWAAANPTFVSGGIEYQNREFTRPTPGAGNSWVALFVIPGYGKVITLGPNPTRRRSGIVQVNINVDPQLGTKPANVIAASLDDFFNDVELLVGSNGLIRFFEVSRLRPIGLRDGWHTSVLTIPYSRDS